MDEVSKILPRLNMENMSNARILTGEERARRDAEVYNEGEGDENERDGYDCPICKNKGLVARVEQASNGVWYYRIGNCECKRVRRSIRRMERSGLKNIIKDYTLDKYETNEAWQRTIKQAASDYAANPEGWFFIGGQSGAGKTHICTAICREFLLAGREVVYMLWRDDATKLKGLVNSPEEREPAMDRLKNAEVLYIDDLFKTGKAADGEKQYPTTADINLAFELLNYRYNNPKQLTIISSECTAGELVDIDEAVGGRIFERARTINLAPDRDRNYRLKKAMTI